MANEEAKYDVIKSTTSYEIRKYSDRLAVEVISENGNSGFRKLFNYISGNNEKKQEIKMTTPVTCLLYTSPSPRDATLSRMPSSA